MTIFRQPCRSSDRRAFAWCNANSVVLVGRGRPWRRIKAEIDRRIASWYGLASVAFALVAQRIEHQPSKLRVGGSSPSGRTLCAPLRFLAAVGVVLGLAGWPVGVARAAPSADCGSGLPADLAAQLQPLLQALSDASGDVPGCDSAQPDARGQAQPSQHQRDLQLIAETLALLALADPGYGYAAPAYAYAP